MSIKKTIIVVGTLALLFSMIFNKAPHNHSHNHEHKHHSEVHNDTLVLKIKIKHRIYIG